MSDLPENISTKCWAYVKQYDHRSLSFCAKLVFNSICYLPNVKKQKASWISNRRLAIWVGGISERKIQKHLLELENINLIERVVDGRKRGIYISEKLINIVENMSLKDISEHATEGVLDIPEHATEGVLESEHALPNTPRRACQHATEGVLDIPEHATEGVLDIPEHATEGTLKERKRKEETERQKNEQPPQAAEEAREQQERASQSQDIEVAGKISGRLDITSPKQTETRAINPKIVIKNPKTKLPSQIDLIIDRIWMLYPSQGRTNKKQVCLDIRTSMLNLLKEGYNTPVQALRHIGMQTKEYAKTVEKHLDPENARFIPTASKWFSEARFNDSPEAWALRIKRQTGKIDIMSDKYDCHEENMDEVHRRAELTLGRKIPRVKWSDVKTG